MVSEATPLLSRVAAGPNTVPRCLNVTVPVGTAAPYVGVTVAVKVMSWPNADGFGFEVRVVVVGSFWMTWATAAEVLPMSVALPEYTAVI